MMIEFLKTSAGRFTIAALALLILMVVLGIIKSKRQYNLKALVFSSIAIAIATAVSMVPLLSMPQGGSITLFSMFFITLIGFWFGPVEGILCGITYGMLQLAIKPSVYYPLQIILDYPLAYGMLGLSGFFYKKADGLVNGFVLGVFGRFVCSFISGAVFFGSYAPEGFSPFAYSAAYNVAYLGGEAFLTLVILAIPSVKQAIVYVKKTSIIN